MTPPDVTTGRTVDRLIAIAREKAGDYELGADPVVDALWDALDALEEERDALYESDRDARLELEEMKHLVHALAVIDENVADLERGIRDAREVVRLVRDTIDRAQDYGGPCPVRTGGASL